MAVTSRGGALEFDAVIKDSQFAATIASIKKELESLTNSANKEGQAIEGYMKKVTQAIGAYASFAAASNFISDVVRVRGEFQQLEVAFNTMLGSKAKADKLMAEVVDFASTTPFELTEVAGATKQLLAFGIGVNDIKSTLRSLGDVAAGIGQPLGEIAYLYGTIKTAGKAEREDIKQFAQRGIPIYEALAKVLKVSTTEVNDLVSAGKVGFPEIEAAFKNMTGAGSQFGGLMAAQAKTLTGQISNLQDAWAQMLNEIGRSNEGVFASAIGTATKLVDNYETIIDILKVLVITYGSYRAAIIATNAITAISTTLAQGYTIAETLRFQAMVISERAMKLLNSTMLANPTVAVITAVAALTSAFLVFKRETVNVVKAQDLLADAQKDIAGKLAETQAKIAPYLIALKNANLSEQERVNIYEKLKAINPDIVKDLDAKTLKYDDLAKNVNIYIEALRNQLRLEANSAALTASIKQEQKIQEEIDFKRDQIAKIEERIKKAKDSEERGLEQFQKKTFETDLKVLEDKLKEQQRQSALIGTKRADEEIKKGNEEAEAIKKSIAYYEKLIKALQEEQKANSTTAKERIAYDEKILKLQKELEAITGKQAAKDGKKEETEAEKRRKKLEALEESIADAERRARQSGLLKEESEIDKINARYDELMKRAEELKADDSLKIRIENSRTTEIGNERVREEVEQYKKSIDAQKDVFDQFEEAKKEIGIENARAMFAEQTRGFESFLAYLEAQGSKFVGIKETYKGRLSNTFLEEQINKEDKATRKRQEEEEKKRLADVLKETTSFNAKRKQIEDNYQKDLAVLRKRYSGSDLAEREKILQESRDEELEALQNDANRQSEIYKKLNKDITFYTKEQLKATRDSLQKFLKENPAVPPEFKKQIEDYIQKLDELIKAPAISAKALKDLTLVRDLAGVAADSFRSMADSVRDTNSGLADTLDTMGDVMDIAKNGISAAISAATGDIAGAVSSTFAYYQSIFDFAFTGPKRTAAETAKALQEYQAQIFAGELAINELYRERSREQAKLNKAKLEGIKAEKQLLDEQKKAVQDEYNMVLQQLQNEQAIIGKTSEKYGGILGIGEKTRVVNITEALAGKSYDDLEKLFMKGQLEGKAKELFELLQKLKLEGADIDNLITQNALAVKEAFTGTTSDSITDTILDGFKNGLKGARDFADTFQDLMQNAILQALKYQTLEEPLKAFYEQFAGLSESGGILTEEEIRLLEENFNAIINNAGEKFDELQQITGVDLSGTGSDATNSLSAAVKGITQQQADLLAGQFGGLRITALDQLKIAQTTLSTLQTIQNHTSNLEPMYRLWQRLETDGLKVK